MSGARAYYNEIDPDAAAILRQLVADDVIAPGDVDERSIKDVRPGDLAGYAQCHFFAGGGLWSVAARLAGWPDTRPLWTGSCPCQPFSQAGKGRGTDDARHLWPDFHRLIDSCRPAVVMGEQVAGKAGRNWFHGVRADLERSGYAGRAVDVPACAVDAPHERNRLWWIAVADSEGLGGRRDIAERGQEGRAAAWWSDARPVGHGIGAGWEGQPDARRIEGYSLGRSDAQRADRRDGGQGDVADSEHRPVDLGTWDARGQGRQRQAIGGVSGSALERGLNGSWWADAEWIVCHDGKARRTKSGLRLLVDGLPGRVGLWRVAGNAISPVLAAEIISAFLETEG